MPKKTVFQQDKHTYAGPTLSNYICENCGRQVGTWWRDLPREDQPHYCQWCGAKNIGEGGEWND